MTTKHRRRQKEELLNRESKYVKIEEKRVKGFHVTKPANSMKDISRDIQEQLAVAWNFLANIKLANGQALKWIESIPLGDKTAVMTKSSSLFLAGGLLDDQRGLTTSLELQTQNVPACEKK